MKRRFSFSRGWVLALALPFLSLGMGCQTDCGPCGSCIPDVPRELSMVTHPTYRIAPTDVLLIDVVRVIPSTPYKLAPLDVLQINSTNALPTEPIGGLYPIGADGTVDMGGTYGRVRVGEGTIDDAKRVIDEEMAKKKLKTTVSVTLAQFRGLAQIRGEHMVGPDGTIRLGLYGSVYITGMTLDEAKVAVEQHLAKFLTKPEVSMDIYSYNSQAYYVITDGGGYGERVQLLPSTGNDTVLRAVGHIGGLGPVSSKKRIWVARPAPANSGPDQILKVEWEKITQHGQEQTNYQLFPGDRLYVMAEPMVTTDTFIARLVSPIERLFGVALLGNGTVRALDGQTGGAAR